MIVQTIHYERKMSDGAYGNRALAATASVDEGEDVALAMGQLILLVRSRLAQDAAQEQEEQERRHAAEVERYRAEQALVRRRYEEAAQKNPEATRFAEEDPYGEGEHGDEDDDADESGERIPF